MISVRSVLPSEMEVTKNLIRRIFPDAIVSIHDEDTLLLAEHLGRLVGFAHMVDVGDRLVLQGIGVEESMRGHGVGSLLLQHAIESYEEGVPVYLKVKAMNPAVEFYARHGFFLKKFGERVHVLVRMPEA